MRVLLSAFFGLALLAGTVSAEERVPTITLSATGSVTAQPDRGYISLGVVTKAETSTEAVAENAKRMSALYESLDALGITKDNVRTVNFSVHQVFKDVPLEGFHATNPQTNRVPTERVPDGYQVYNMVQVTVCELDTFGKVLDAAVQDGANAISSISFGSSKETELTDEARAEAVRRVLAKAKIFTDGLGVALGEVTDITEAQSGYGNKMRYSAMAASADVAETAVSGGSLTFTATVTVRWVLETPKPDKLQNRVKPILNKVEKVLEEVGK
jgi:uncharacterized protein YggE